MSAATTRPAKLPPPWFIHTAWHVHRALYRLSGGRFLWTTSNKRGWGALLLTTIGRRSGKERRVIVGYIEDGPNLVTLAMNGGDEGHPAWWLNLEAHPDAVVRLARQDRRAVHARVATGEERDRLWKRWTEIDVGNDTIARRRSIETPVIVLEPPQRNRLNARSSHLEPSTDLRTAARHGVATTSCNASRMVSRYSSESWMR